MGLLDDIMPEKNVRCYLIWSRDIKWFLVTISMTFTWRREDRLQDNALFFFSLVLIFNKYDIWEMFVLINLRRPLKYRGGSNFEVRTPRFTLCDYKRCTLGSSTLPQYLILSKLLHLVKCLIKCKMGVLMLSIFENCNHEIIQLEILYKIEYIQLTNEQKHIKIWNFSCLRHSRYILHDPPVELCEVGFRLKMWKVKCLNKCHTMLLHPPSCLGQHGRHLWWLSLSSAHIKFF